MQVLILCVFFNAMFDFAFHGPTVVAFIVSLTTGCLMWIIYHLLICRKMDIGSVKAILFLIVTIGFVVGYTVGNLIGDVGIDGIFEDDENKNLNMGAINGLFIMTIMSIVLYPVLKINNRWWIICCASLWLIPYAGILYVLLGEFKYIPYSHDFKWLIPLTSIHACAILILGGVFGGYRWYDFGGGGRCGLLMKQFFVAITALYWGPLIGCACGILSYYDAYGSDISKATIIVGL